MSRAQTYQYDAVRRIWRTPLHTEFHYTDGDDVELRLLTILRKCSDVSVDSAELQCNITDWPTEYHFSPLRGNLLRPLTLGPSCRVLELGCGCGALTRYLGEAGAEVVAVEGSTRRAEIAAERCRDLPNVRIYCDNLTTFDSLERFDVVTLVGVLEYAPLYVPGGNPVGRCIAAAMQRLVESGTLVLAIENQLGLKYLNGCSEDHVGVPYFGIENLYDESTAQTFGQSELERVVRSAAAPRHIRFAYPFPDYKLPEIIVSANGISDPDFDAASLLCKTISRDPILGRRAFRENLARFPVARNGLLGQLANSFLLIASPGEPRFCVSPKWLASTYATRRLKSLATETKFVRNDDGIFVVKTRLFASPAVPPPAAETQFHWSAPAPSRYLTGRLLLADLQRHAALGRWVPGFSDALAPWVNLLREHADSTAVLSATLPAWFVDCIPANIILTANGHAQFIDTEWTANTRIPLTWILVRGIANALAYSSPPESERKIVLQSLVRTLLGHHHIVLDDDAFRLAARWEDAFSLAANGGSPPGGFSARLQSDLWALDGVWYSNAAIEKLTRDVQQLTDDLAAIRGTWAWKWAAPLRVAETSFRRWLSKRR